MQYSRGDQTKIIKEHQQEENAHGPCQQHKKINKCMSYQKRKLTWAVQEDLTQSAPFPVQVRHHSRAAAFGSPESSRRGEQHIKQVRALHVRRCGEAITQLRAPTAARHHLICWRSCAMNPTQLRPACSIKANLSFYLLGDRIDLERGLDLELGSSL